MTEDDSARRWAYLAEGNATQARKRVSAKVLLRDEDGRVLLVDPTYKEGWDLPGGMAEANEPPRVAAAREVEEELGVAVEVGRVLLLDWVGPHGPWDDQLVFVFDGGSLTAEQVGALRVADDELNGFTFVPAGEAASWLRADMGERLDRALRAARTGETVYGERHVD